MSTRLWSALRREPLVHFLALAALLFVANGLLTAERRETIVVDQATIDFLVEQQREMLGRTPSKAERAALVQSFVDDEVLLREAYRRGLDRDTVVRRHLLQKMRFVLGEEAPEPSAAELRTYYEANQERYRSPPTLTLDHVYYADPARVPEDLLAQLRDGVDFSGLGDRLYMLGSTLQRYSLRDLIGLLGPAVAREVFELPVGEWQGPLTSDKGVHFVRVAARQPPRVPALDEVENYVRQDWLLARQGAAVADKLQELRGHYDIVVRDAAG